LSPDSRSMDFSHRRTLNQLTRYVAIAVSLPLVCLCHVFLCVFPANVRRLAALRLSATLRTTCTHQGITYNPTTADSYLRILYTCDKEAETAQWIASLPADAVF